MSETKETEAMTVRPAHALMRPVANAGDLMALNAEVTDLISKALVVDTDYGVIPGTDRGSKDKPPKPALLKPGAERIAAAFGCYPRYQIVEKEVDHDREVRWVKRKKKWDRGKYAGEEEQSGISLGLYRYVISCEIVNRSSGEVVAQAIGSCSSMESKYIDRPRDCENTVIKMASKRSLVAAVLNGFSLSDRFDQDLEDGAETNGKPAPAEPPTLADTYVVERLAALAVHPEAPEKIRNWLGERLQKAQRAGGLTADSAKKILGGLKPELLALVPPIDPDSAPAWMGETAERVPGEEIE